MTIIKARDNKPEERPAWRRWTCIALLMCMLGPVPVSYAADAPADTVTFNFVGADVEAVAKAVGQFLRVTFLGDPRIKGTLNRVTERPVPLAQAMKLLTAVLRMQG